MPKRNPRPDGSDPSIPDHLRHPDAVLGPDPASSRGAVSSDQRSPGTASNLRSQNAITHGAYSTRIPLPGVEDAAEWIALRDGYFEYFEPDGAPERELVHRIAEVMWRIRRIAPAEAELSAVARERVAGDFSRKQGIIRPDSLEVADRRIAAVREAIEPLERFLDDPASIDPNTVMLAPDAAHEFIAAAAARDYTYIHTTPPPEAPVALSDLLAFIGEIARDDEIEDPEDLSRTTLGRLKDSLRRRIDHRDYFVAETARMHRERVLPLESLASLNKLEAHLTRQLAQAMSNLEALQARRQGRPLPLARVHFESGA